MVDVVYVETDVDLLPLAGSLDGRATLVQGNQVSDRGNDVVHGQHRGVERKLNTELAVELVTAHLGEVVTLGVEVEVVQQQTRRLCGYLLARTELAVDVLESFFLGDDGVLVQGLLDGGEADELGADLFRGHSERLQEDGDGLLALAVDANANLVALVDLELEPCTTARNDANSVNFLVARLVDGALEVHTGASHQLGHHDALGAIDDEGALLGHQREVAHEHRLGLDFTGLVVHELGFDIERSGVGLTALLALFERILLFLQRGVRERQLHGLGGVLDGGDLLEDLLKSAPGGDDGQALGLGLGDSLLPGRRTDEPFEALGLQCQQIGDLDGVANFGERESTGDSTVLGSRGRCGARSSQEI